MPNGWVPSSRGGPATNSCSKAGMTSTAICPTPEPTGSVRTGRSAVVEVDQRGDTVGDDGMAAAASDVGDGGDTARVALEARVVQPLGGGCCRVLHGRPPVVGGEAATGAACWGGVAGVESSGAEVRGSAAGDRV